MVRVRVEFGRKCIQLLVGIKEFLKFLIMIFSFELVHKACRYHCAFLLAGEDDLRDMISAVTSLAGRWKDLGISLGVRAGDLDTVLANNPHSSNNCLREVLSLWLRQGYNVCTTLI